MSYSLSLNDKASQSALNLWLIFLFLAYFSVVPQILFAVGHIAKWSEVVDPLLYSIPWLLIPVVAPKYFRIWLLFVGIASGIVSCVIITYYAIFSQQFGQSVFMAAMETNPKEVAEFFGIYFRWWLPALILLFIAPAIIIYRFIRQPDFTRRQRLVVLSMSALLLLVPLVKSPKENEHRGSRLMRHYEHVEPIGMIQQYLAYRENFAQSSRMLHTARDVKQSAGAIKLDDLQSKQTYVLVIGESTNRQRMSLYGYERETSPELKKISNELFIYKDVIAAIPYTIDSLSTALTFAGLPDVRRAFSYMNIVTLMQGAGFKVYWITNQQNLSKRNTVLTTFASLADEVVFLNTNQKAYQPDEVVFPDFKNALSDPAEKKLIVVHLMGSHFRYDYRFPESYKKFTGDVPKHKKVKTAEDVSIYNDYDNSLLYNDFVVSRLIEMYKHSDPYGVLVYFADHGEEAFDVRHFYGHGGVPSTNMYTVPFLLWPSSSWKDRHDISALQAGLNRPYSLGWFLHGWCDLVGIQFDKCKSEKSIFSAEYKPVSRWIGLSIDDKPMTYDKLVNTEKNQVLE